MKFSILSTFVVALAAESVVASSWFSKAAYNKWHETELERWLSDHDVPYPTPADRKDLENLVKDNWQRYAAQPYQDWDTKRLIAYLEGQGQSIKKGAEKNRDSLVSQVKENWYEKEEQASDAYNNVKDWIFDSWTESQLKSFLDRHDIPNPNPRTRDTFLSTVRSNYQAIATKAGETAAYPGNWLYATWSDSELKSWLDEQGIPAPQPSSRDKLIAAVRRHSRLASQSLAASHSSASASAEAAKATLADALLDSWSESQIKEWADKNGIKVPQGSTRNELLALARKHRARLTGDNVEGSLTRGFGAATTGAGNEYARATDAVWAAFDWTRAKLGLLGDDFVKAGDRAAEEAARAKHKAQEGAQKATNVAKEEL